MAIDLNLEHVPKPPKMKHDRIGAVGAGFIMRECHLVTYRNPGCNAAAVACDVSEQAREVAPSRSVPKVCGTYQELLAGPAIEVVDIAVPPQHQLAVAREAVKHKHIKGILAQKPLAADYREAKEVVRVAEKSRDHAGGELEHALRAVDAGAQDRARAAIWGSPCWRPSRCVPSRTGRSGSWNWAA